MAQIPDNIAKINDIYTEQIWGSSFASFTVGKLEVDQYLEKTLWPAFVNNDESNHNQLLMSIVALVNQKYREGVEIWETFKNHSEKFSTFLAQTTRLMLSNYVSGQEKIALLIFFIRCFNSIEIELIRQEIQKYISMPIWSCLSAARLELEFKKVPKFKKFWKKLQKNDQNLSAEQLEQVQFERTFLYNLIFDFFKCLNQIPALDVKTKLNGEEMELVHYCERFLEFLIDIESLLPTRRFFNALLDDLHVITIARLSAINKRPIEGNCLFELIDN